MIDGFVVVRVEKHIDDKFWVFKRYFKALKVAEDVVAYWNKEYGVGEDGDTTEVDNDLYGDHLFNHVVEDGFHVCIQPQQIDIED